MVFPQSILFPLPSPKRTGQPRISRQDPTVRFYHSLLPHKQPGTEVAQDKSWAVKDLTLPSEFLCPTLGLGERDLEGKPQTSDRRWAKSFRTGDSAFQGPAQPPHPQSLPLRPRPSQQIPGGGAKGRRQPGSEARPSGQSIRVLFAPTWSPEERWRAGAGPGAGPGREGDVVTPEGAGPRRGGSLRSA